MTKKKKKSKRKVVKKKRSYKKRKNKKLQIFLIIIIIIFIILLILNIPPIINRDKSNIKLVNSYVIPLHTPGYYLLNYSIYNNNNNAYVDCLVTFDYNNKIKKWYTPIISPFKEYQDTMEFYYNGSISKATIDPDCDSIEKIDITNCDETTLKLCQVSKNNTKILQCLSGEISYQYFCSAIITKKIELCELILEERGNVICKAHVSGDYTKCEELSRGQDYCYFDYSINKRNVKVCNDINDYNIKNACLGINKNDYTMCLDISERYKFICMINIAHHTNNPEFCEYVEDVSSCYEEVKDMLH